MRPGEQSTKVIETDAYDVNHGEVRSSRWHTFFLNYAKFNGLRRDILWQGTGTRNMTEIPGTHKPTKRAANYMARTGLCGEFARVYLAHTEQNPQQAAENLDVGLKP